MKILPIYYLATPAFAILDATTGINVRASIPGDSQAFYYLYLAVCFVCGMMFYNAPIKAAIFALIECSINILLLVLSVMLPVFMIAAGGTFQFGLQEITHFLIAGSMLAFSFHNNPLLRRNRF